MSDRVGRGDSRWQFRSLKGVGLISEESSSEELTIFLAGESARFVKVAAAASTIHSTMVWIEVCFTCEVDLGASGIGLGVVRLGTVGFRDAGLSPPLGCDPTREEKQLSSVRRRLWRRRSLRVTLRVLTTVSICKAS
uniref:Uncharacterized protein n=1 Tax=Cannabis sativa TaxID=3483 RepID=A0A803Q0E2_CANSA